MKQEETALSCYAKHIIKALLFTAIFVFIHESTHYEIAQMYKCDIIGFGFNYVSIDLSTCLYPESVMLANAVNEVVGYCLAIIFAFVILFMREK